MKVDVYEDAKGEYRWRLKAGNGRIIADGGEGYGTRSGLAKALTRLRKEAVGVLGLALQRALVQVDSLKKLKVEK